MATLNLSSQVVSTMLEQVEPKLSQFLVNRESKFSQMFKKQNKKHNISTWTAGGGAVLGWRIPVTLSNGGDYQFVSLDSGDLGSGSMMVTNYMTVGAFESDFAMNIPARVMYASGSKQQAIIDVLQTQIGNAMRETALYNEIGLFQDSTGILATSTSVVSGNGNAGTTVVYQLETAAFTYDRLRGKNALVDVCDSGNVIRAVGARVTSINFASNQVTITVGAANYSPATGDKLVFPGIGPITSTTLASGSWRNGIYTFNTTNTTGSLLGLAYSTAYELACPAVNANNGFYTPSVIFAGKSQLTQRRDDEAVSGLVGVCHMAQRTAWYLEGLTIANNLVRNGEAVKAQDLAGQGTKYGDTFDAGDITHHVSRYADKSRVDWLNPSNFGYVQLSDEQFFKTPDGQRTFVGRSSTTGNPTANFQSYIVCTRNYFSVDPGCSLVAYSLQVPSGQ